MKMGIFAARSMRVFLFFLFGLSLGAQAAEVKLLSGSGFRSVVNEVAPQFEKATGHKIVGIFESTGALRKLVNAGESFDVLLIGPELIDELTKQGRIVARSSVSIARAGVGVGVRAGSTKPDIGSVDAFRRTMLNAKSIAYVGEGTGGAYFVGLLDRLGIADEMKPKIKSMGVATVVKAAASGEADLVVHLVPAILAESRVDLVGPFPAEIQFYTGFAGALSSAAMQPEAGKSLIDFLRSNATVAVIKAKGMDTPAP
jgi:molybdate transport system substrate-binding protein